MTDPTRVGTFSAVSVQRFVSTVFRVTNFTALTKERNNDMAVRRKKRLKRPTQHEIASEGLPSASGFDANFRCLGRWALTKRLPPEGDSSDSMRGVRIHAALEISDLSGLSKSDAITASRIMYGESELVQSYDFEGAEVEWEQRFWDVDDNMNHLWSAQIDTLHIKRNGSVRLLVSDNKTGWARPVAIENNWQVKSQAALLGVEYYDAEEVVAALIHPHHPDSLHESVVYTRDDLESNLVTTRHMVAAIQQPDQPRTVGGVQCQYCPAKRICPEYQAYVAKMEQDIADEIEDRGFTAIIRRTPKERGTHVAHLKQLAKHIAEILDQYTQLAVKDQTAIAGWTLRRKMNRIITDEVEAMSLVKGEFGADALYDATKFSITALEENLARKMTKKEAKAAVERLLSPVLKFKTSDAYLQESRSL